MSELRTLAQIKELRLKCLEAIMLCDEYIKLSNRADGSAESYMRAKQLEVLILELRKVLQHSTE